MSPDVPGPLPIAEPLGGGDWNPSCQICTCRWTAEDGTEREGCPAEVIAGGEYLCLLCFLEMEADETGIWRWLEAWWAPAAEAPDQSRLARAHA